MFPNLEVVGGISPPNGVGELVRDGDSFYPCFTLVWALDEKSPPKGKHILAPLAAITEWR